MDPTIQAKLSITYKGQWEKLRREKVIKDYCKENDLKCSECNECPDGFPPRGTCIEYSEGCITLMTQVLVAGLFDKPSDVPKAVWHNMSILEALRFNIIETSDIDIEDLIPDLQ